MKTGNGKRSPGERLVYPTHAQRARMNGPPERLCNCSGNTEILDPSLRSG